MSYKVLDCECKNDIEYVFDCIDNSDLFELIDEDDLPIYSNFVMNYKNYKIIYNYGADYYFAVLKSKDILVNELLLDVEADIKDDYANFNTVLVNLNVDPLALNALQDLLETTLKRVRYIQKETIELKDKKEEDLK